MSRTLTVYGALALLGVVTVGWCSRSPAHSVDVAAATRGPLRITVATNGTVEPIDETIVRARLDGRIVEIPEPGTLVHSGRVVLRIDDGPVAAALSESRSERLALLDSLRVAEDELDRVRKRAASDEELFEHGAITKTHFAETRASLESAEARVLHLKEEVPLRVAGLDLRIQELSAQKEAAVVQSPHAGTVYRTEYKSGATVTAGDPVMRIADLERLRIRMNVDQADLGRVNPGQRVRITANAYPGRSWSARVSEVVPHVVVKDSRAVADGLAPVAPPSEGLVPGMTVDVEILVEDVTGALQVPARAVFSNAGDPFVYQVRRGRARSVPVRLGRASATAVEILEGVGPDDVVVMGPVNGIRDGDRVEIRRQDDRGS
jgi:HlyD family secretion protein